MEGETMKKQFSKLSEDIDNQQNDLFRSALIGDMMTREAIASVALDHDPRCQTQCLTDEEQLLYGPGISAVPNDDLYRECALIEFPSVCSVLYTDGHNQDGFYLGVLGMTSSWVDMLADELAFFVESGIIHVRYRFQGDELCQYFQTNSFVVWE
jgi:hypothetical protein